MEEVEYRFRQGGHRVSCTFRFHYGEAGGLQLDSEAAGLQLDSEAGGLQLDSLTSLARSEVTCTANTQASLAPTGDTGL